MIELRWLVSGRNDWERVLQYREGASFYQSVAIDTNGQEIFSDTPIFVGTEWRDVPAVKDGA